MKKITFPYCSFKASKVGIGGHYKAMEQGRFENCYAYIDKEVEERIEIIEKAFKSGVNYFDTTWRNEVDILAKVLRHLKIRDKVFVNGMVLGAFTASKSLDENLEDYFNKWLDYRLENMPDHRFDSFMINAIEEGFNHKECERLIKLLDSRKTAGDFKLFGFSTHDPRFARELLEKYPEFKIVMTPYNFKNRCFKEAFQGYKENTILIIMKPLVWMEYGVPFCAINKLPSFKKHFGFEPVLNISTMALDYILENPKVSTVVCSVNSIEEVENLTNATKNKYNEMKNELLEKYNKIQSSENGIPLFLSGLLFENLRMNKCSLGTLSRRFDIKLPEISLNEYNSRDIIIENAKKIVEVARKKGYSKYLENYKL